MSSNSIKIPPYHYLHVLDRNSNVTRLEVGPQTFIKQDHETITTGKEPIKMIVLPPNYYCQITNPVIRDKEGKLVQDQYGQVSVQFGEIEYRFPGTGLANVYDQFRQPFPLYPKEILSIAPEKCIAVKEKTALKLVAIRDYEDLKSGVQIKAGDEYLLYGPVTYQPKIYEKIDLLVTPYIIESQEAIQIKAKQAFKDRFGVERQQGEEYLVRQVGYFLPDVHEDVIKVVKPYILNDQRALQLRATKNFKDIYGVQRLAGEEWLITNQNASYHIFDICEEFVKAVTLTVLTKDQFCIVLNPINPKTGKNQFGAREVRVGQSQFFLQPGEELERDQIRDIYLLQEDEALLLRAQEPLKQYKIQERDDSGKLTEKVKDLEPGDRWMLYGPGRYVPSIEVEVIETRSKIPLDKNEGIYVRDNKTGSLRAVIGESYMLKACEDLFDMEIGETVEKLLKPHLVYDKNGNRIKFRLITYKVQYNCAVQVYNYKTKESRIVFGPNLVMLQPDEQFTVTTLSGKTPKVQGVIKTLYIMMGPDFSTDIIKVETSDHAPLSITLSYNWQFRVKQGDKDSELSIFNVKDFVGDMCNLMASKIRSAVAAVDFDTFHKGSAQIIRKTVFGANPQTGKINNEFNFPKNNLVVTNVDIQNVEPIDPKTRESLQKTVTMAIDITTSRQQAQARHLSNQRAQDAKGEMMKLKIEDQSLAEVLKRNYLELQSEAQSVINSGDAKAQALAQAEAAEIEGQSKVELAKMNAEALKIIQQTQIEYDFKKQSLLQNHDQLLTELEIKKQKELAEIESKKFESMVEAIGQKTLVAMAQSGPEQQAELLQGLGLQGYIVTDGNNPINLFNTAQGLIGQNGLPNQN